MKGASLARLRARFRSLRDRLGPHQGPAVAFAILFAIGTHAFFHTTVFDGRPADEAHADGHYYYAYLLSLWADHDLHFANQYLRPVGKNVYGFERTATGRLANPFSIGPALLWAPFYAAIDLETHAARRFYPDLSLDGTSERFQHATLYGSFIYGFVALLLLYGLACRRTSPPLACLAAVGACLGGVLVFYAIVEPSYAHADQAFCAALFVYLWDPLARSSDRPPSFARAAALGLILGLAADVRAQDILFCLLPATETAARLVRRRRLTPLLPEIASLGTTAALAGIAFLPQMLAWRALYGHLLTLPQGPGYMVWAHPRILASLFSTRSGLFPWAPIWWIAALVGLPLWLARREVAALGALLVGIAEAWTIGATWDWWGGGAFGGRRYASLTVFAAIALAILFERLSAAVRRRPERAAALMAAALVALLAGYNLGLVLASKAAPGPPRAVAPTDLARRAAGALADRIEQITGDPFAWPANLLFAIGHDLPVRRWDELVGTVFEPCYASLRWATPVRIELANGDAEPLRLHGFGAPFRWAEGGTTRKDLVLPLDAPRACLWLDVRPCLILPRTEPDPIRIALEIASVSGPAEVRLTLGDRLLTTAVAGGRFQTVSADAPAADFESAPTELCVESVAPAATAGVVLRRLSLVEVRR